VLIFLSDIHLGTRACQAQRLLDFLREYDSERLFLVGDIVDFWAMGQRGVYWSAAMNTFVQKVLKRARHGVEVVLVPGNHDELLREHGTTFYDIRTPGVPATPLPTASAMSCCTATSSMW
jgi:UDP-2,3-diacylglucosamine pyrophosphatase LpxH